MLVPLFFRDLQIETEKMSVLCFINFVKGIYGLNKSRGRLSPNLLLLETADFSSVRHLWYNLISYFLRDGGIILVSQLFSKPVIAFYHPEISPAASAGEDVLIPLHMTAAWCCQR